MTNWEKRDEAGLFLPEQDTHCVVALLDNDGESFYHENCIYMKEGHFVKINDGIGEIVKPESVQGYFTYTSFSKEG